MHLTNTVISGQSSADWKSIPLVDFLDASLIPTVIVDLESASSATSPSSLRPYLVYRNNAVSERLATCFLDDTDLANQALGGVATINAAKRQFTNVCLGQYRILTMSCENHYLEKFDNSLDNKPVPTLSEDARREHIDLIRNQVNWAATPIGSPEEWTQTVHTFVNLALASPFPVILSLGPDRTFIYNRPYADVIGGRQLGIMGLSYGEAWPEYKETVDQYMDKAYDGYGSHFPDAEVFLNRNGLMEEECYFTWFVVPIRDETGKIAGAFIPNFETTHSVVSSRRFQIFQTLSQELSLASNPCEFYRRAKASLATNPIDLPFVAIYSCGEDEFDIDSSGTQSSEGGRDNEPERRNREEAPRLRFSLEVLIGCQEDHPAVPGIVDSDLTCFENEPEESIMSFGPYLRKIHAGEEMLHVPREVVCRMLADVCDPTWGDQISHLVVVAIRPDGDRLRAVAIVGPNTRRPQDSDSKVFIELLNRHLSAGLAGVMLFTEELRRTRFLAELEKRKNEELSSQLEIRTRELKASEGRFTRMAEASLIGLWTSAPNGNINFVNEAWWSVSGHPRHLPVHRFLDSVHPDDQRWIRQKWYNNAGTTVELEFRWKTLTDKGQPRWTLAVSNPEIDETTGKLMGYIGVLSDISERKANEELLRLEALEAVERKRQQEAFIDMTSHEMRNPLGAVIHSVDLVVARGQKIQEDIQTGRYNEEECLDGLQDILDTMDIISHCASHITRIADSTLTLSKLESDLVVITPVLFQPKDLVHKTLRMFNAEFQAKDIESSFLVLPGYAACGVDWVEADAARVSQILINLLTNSIKFTNEQSIRNISITLDCTLERPTMPNPIVEEEDNDCLMSTSMSKSSSGIGGDPKEQDERDKLFLVLTVCDSGVGMSESDKGILFQRFSQIKARTHTFYGGSGLGLYISRRLAHLLGGEISVQSTKGEGSEFSFYVETRRCSGPPHSMLLPSERGNTFDMHTTALKEGLEAVDGFFNKKIKSVPGISRQLSGHIEKPCRHILLVEDNLINQRLLHKQLLSIGCIVSIANNGQEAIDYICSTIFSANGGKKSLDLCLMDIEMPVMDGLTAARKIREMQNNGKIIRHVPIIAVSANVRDEQKQMMMSAGMDSAVSKPFRLPTLLQEMEKILTKISSSKTKLRPKQPNHN